MFRIWNKSSGKKIWKEIDLLGRVEYTYKENNPYLIDNIFIKSNNDDLIIKEKVVTYDNQDNIFNIIHNKVKNHKSK